MGAKRITKHIIGDPACVVVFVGVARKVVAPCAGGISLIAGVVSAFAVRKAVSTAQRD